MLVFIQLPHMGSMAIENEQMLICEKDTTSYRPFFFFFENKYNHPGF